MCNRLGAKVIKSSAAHDAGGGGLVAELPVVGGDGLVIGYCALGLEGYGIAGAGDDLIVIEIDNGEGMNGYGIAAGAGAAVAEGYYELKGVLAGTVKLRMGGGCGGLRCGKCPLAVGYFGIDGGGGIGKCYGVLCTRGAGIESNVGCLAGYVDLYGIGGGATIGIGGLYPVCAALPGVDEGGGGAGGPEDIDTLNVSCFYLKRISNTKNFRSFNFCDGFEIGNGECRRSISTTFRAGDLNRIIAGFSNFNLRAV